MLNNNYQRFFLAKVVLFYYLSKYFAHFPNISNLFLKYEYISIFTEYAHH